MATSSAKSIQQSQDTSGFKLIDNSKETQSISYSSDVKSGGGQLFNQQTYVANPTAPSPGKVSDVYDNSRQNGTISTPTNMFEYMMGIKDISLTNETYTERQALVTKPIVVSGNVKEIELLTTENHPVFDSIGGIATTRRTSIEYYISYKDNPSLEDWKPILPKGEKKVIGERLFFNGKQATLRFAAELQTLVVFKDGIELSKDDILIINTKSISIPKLDAFSIYTINYTPESSIANPWTIEMDNFKSDVRTNKQVFKGTAYNKSLQLDYYPYIDYAKIAAIQDYNPNTSTYKPISVRLINASLSGQNNTRIQTVNPYSKDEKTYTYNKTLYKDKSWSSLVPYSIDPSKVYLGFDYYQWKNKLVFTETFNAAQTVNNRSLTHGLADIEVTYDYLATNFRLKAILRRNTASEITVTPELLDYTIKFKTIK